MAQSDKKYSDIEPDIRPDFLGSTDNGGDSDSSQSLKDLEANPEKTNNDSVREQESQGGSRSTQEPWTNNVKGKDEGKGKGKGFFKKKGPISAIILLLGGGGIGLMGLLSPSMLLVHMKEALFDFTNDSRPALEIRSNKMLRKKFNDMKNAFEESSPGKCNIKCKFGSVNDTMIKNLEAKGFKVDAVEGTGLAKGRFQLRSITFPDGELVRSGKAFNNAINRDPKNAVAFKRVFNSKTAYFLNSKFGKTLSVKFGLDKLSKLKSDVKETVDGKVSSVKDSIKETINKTLGLPEGSAKLSPEARIDSNTKIKSTIDNISVKGGKFSSVNNALAAVCGVYNASRAVSFGVKAVKLAAFASFAMIFLNAADQIKSGDADPDVISVLGDQLTQTDENGKSMTDSLGYRMASYGDIGTASKEDFGSGGGSVIGNMMDKFRAETGIKIAAFSGAAIATAAVAHNFCKWAYSAAADAVDWFVSCAPEISAAIASAAPTLGIGSVASMALCVGKQIVADLTFSKVIGTVLTFGIAYIVKNSIPDLSADTVGEKGGNAIFNGSAQIMGGTAASYGLKAGTKAEIKQYAIDTLQVRQQEEAIARYEAQSTPFDASNKYSFLGSMVSSSGVIGVKYSSSLVSLLSNTAGIIPRSLSVIGGGSANALTADEKSNLYGRCTDPSLLSIGVEADALCNPAFVMSSEEMNTDIDSVVDYMLAKGYIDEDGEVKSDTDYQRYTDYCVNRVAPLGESETGIESDDYEWEIGFKCLEKSDMLSNFRTYTMDKSINDTMDEDLTATNSGGSDEDSTGDIPVDAGTVEYCTKNYLKHDSTSELKSIFGSSAGEVSSNLVSVDVLLKSGPKSVKVHKKAAPCFKAVATALAGVSHRPKTTAGTFNWRTIRGSSNLSMHSFGIAIDFDPGQNGLGEGTPGNCKTNMPDDYVAVWKKFGFRWGGDYNSRCDAMHYEWMGG